MAAKDSFTIEKLNQNNYQNWKFKMQMLLIKEDLYEIITEEIPAQPTADWQKKDKKARALINLSIEDNQIINVKNEVSAKGTWDVLKRIHERSNLSSKLFLLRKLYSQKLDEGGDLIIHITKLLELVDKLKAIGEDINDSHISALMLCSLPKSYDGLITALEARPENELNSEFIRNKLIDEFNRRNYSSESRHENNTRAYKTYSKPGNFKRENKYCSNCKMKSHNTHECWHLKGKGSKNKTQNNNYRGTNNSTKYKHNSSMCFEVDKYSENKHSERQENYNTNLNNNKQEQKAEKHLSFLACQSNKNKWLIDSGSSSHITNDKNLIEKFDNEDKTEVMVANGNILTSLGSGSINLTTINSEGSNQNITLRNVLYVPDIESNLISVSKATQNGCKVIFEKDTCKIMHNNEIFVEGKLNHNMYEMQVYKHDTQNIVQLVKQCDDKNCVQLWHKRLGHRNYSSIKELKYLAKGIELGNCKHTEACETCIKSKLTDAPYPKKAEHRANRPLQLVHSDICGPFKTPTIGGKIYFLTFIDDYSRYTFLYLLNKKSEVLEKLKEYIAITKNKFGRTVQAIRSDNAGEYTGSEIQNYMKEMGIEHQRSVAYCSPQNGVSERKNRSLIEMTRCMLSEANLPQKFWGEAVNAAAYLQNRLPTKSNTVTPYELWNGEKPNLSHIRTFGCKAYAYVTKQKRGKLDDKATAGIFVGYDNRSKGYRIYIEDNNVIISRTVKFLEDTQNESTNQQKQIIDNGEVECTTNENHSPINEGNSLKIDISSDNEINQPDSENLSNQPRRSNRINKGVPPDRFAFTTEIQRIIEPKSWDEIQNMTNPHEKQNWINATKEEMNSLYENKTWDLVDLPPGKRVIGCKWAFKAKYNNSGKLEKYKARLVAKGFSQKYGIDYDETFAPVASHTTIRSFLTMAVYKNLNLRHLDIKTAFLHGDLEEEVYMQQPEGYEKPNEEHKVCKLRKAIYGLKQSARAWNLKIGETLVNMGFTQATSDKCLYKQTHKDQTTYILVYVDDLLVAGTPDNINNFIRQINKYFKITDLGEVSHYLGINIQRPKSNLILIDQENKIQELIEKFNLQDAKPCGTPMVPGYMKSNEDINLLENNTCYRQAIGALLYIATTTRPDILVSVNILSRRIENPRKLDWECIKRIIKYLKSTKNIKLSIDNYSKPILTAYADADWASDPSDRKSTSGNLFKLGNNSIQWITKRQTSVALSSAEAEFISAANATQETIWLVNLLKELDLTQNFPITLYNDNQSTIKLAESDKYHAKTKHIDVKYNLIRHHIKEGVIKLQYIPSEEMTADALTKPLPKYLLNKLKEKMNLLNE